MRITYDMITGAFLSKITEFEFLNMKEETRTEMIDGYIKRAAVQFSSVCLYDLTKLDDAAREINEDIDDGDVDEILEILSEGMVIQWLKPYVYRQELLEDALNTRDFTGYSPANLLLRVGEAYSRARKDYTNMVREYSYVHGNLKELHM